MTAPETASPEQDTHVDSRADGHPVDGDVVAEDTLVEEVSIDGMCGVY